MKKNYLIYGASRSGKSTLAKCICLNSNLSYISMDKMVSALSRTFPELNINHHTRSLETLINFEKFLFSYLKSITRYTNKKNNILYVVEGSYTDLENFISQEFCKNFEIIVLVQEGISKKNLFDNIRKFDTLEDWTSGLSDNELLNYCENILNESARIQKICKKHEIAYYNTAFNRDEVINKIKHEIIKNIEKA